MADEEIKAHMQRGNELMAEVVKEHRLNRAFQAEQVSLLRTVVERNGEAFHGLMAELAHFRERVDVFGERIDRFGDRVDRFGDRVDAFGATLDLQREILLRFLDRLDDREPPQG